MPQLAWWVGYAVGASAVALAALARYALHGSLGSSVPLVAFVPAVFVAAAVGGLRAGLATTALALTVGLSAFVPVAEWDTPGVLVRGALFAAVGATISAALERLRALGALTAEQRQALADAEAYRAIVEEGAAYICRFAPDGTLTFVNEAYCRCFGRARAELLGTAFAPPVPDEDRPLVENWRGALAGGADLPTHEHRVILPDGRVRWLRWTNRVVRDATGGTQYQALGIDITERREAEQALRELTDSLEARVVARTEELRRSEERFRAIFHSQFQFIGLMTVDGTLVEANRTALSATGVSEADVLGRPFWDTAWWAHDAAQRERLKAAVARAAGGEQDRFEAHHPAAGGGRVWVDFSLTPFRDDTGRVVLLIPEGRDITERKRTEAALRQSEQRFRRAFESAAIGMALVSPEGRWLQVNTALCALVGYTEAELLASDFQTLTHPDDLEADLNLVRRVLAGTLPGYQLEKRYFHKNGQTVHVLVAVSLVWDADGRPVHFVAQIKDVTARKRAEQQLRASDALLRQFIKHAPAAVAMFDTELRYLQTSDRWLVDYELTDRSVVGRSQYDVFPDLPDRWKQIHQRVLAGAVEGCDEDAFVRDDGSVVWVQWECRPWYESDGAVGGLIMFTQLNTARKRTEAALRASEELYRSVVESLAEGVVVQDADVAIMTCNDRACAVLGLTRDQMTGRTSLDPRWRTVYEDGTPMPGAEHPSMRVLRTGAPVFGAVMGVCKPAGELAWLRVNVVPVARTGDGPGPATVASFHDITAARALDERVRASLREKELLLKEIHHRVKNNLQIVSALLDLQSGFTTDRAALALFASSRGRVRSMALVHERLYKSHDVARVDFGEYARALATDLFRAYRASDDEVRLEVSATAPPLSLDVAIPCGLLLNELMSNCFKHAFAGGRGGTLCVSLTADGDARELTVADDGPGLPPEFDFRNSASFGLQLVCTLVEQLSGTVEARGPGTVFVVRFRPR